MNVPTQFFRYLWKRASKWQISLLLVYSVQGNRKCDEAKFTGKLQERVLNM
jgi:hypothetical protein